MEFIENTLEVFNFGPAFIGCVKTLYKNIPSVVINNGDISEWFNPMCGVRQGCPISPNFFLKVVELLAIGIRKTPKIKGIEINGNILKIMELVDILLVDDTTCSVADIALVKGILVMFNCFKLCEGLKINTRQKLIILGP